MAKIMGLFKRADGEPYVIWEDDKQRLHVTNGIIDVTEEKAVREYLMLLRRVVAIEREPMLALLERYQPGSPVTELMRGGDRHV